MHNQLVKQQKILFQHLSLMFIFPVKNTQTSDELIARQQPEVEHLL
jgi:hypothetical protein